MDVDSAPGAAASNFATVAYRVGHLTPRAGTRVASELLAQSTALALSAVIEVRTIPDRARSAVAYVCAVDWVRIELVGINIAPTGSNHQRSTL